MKIIILIYIKPNMYNHYVHLYIEPYIYEV